MIHVIADADFEDPEHVGREAIFERVSTERAEAYRKERHY
jgi:hypothetical protein